LGEGDAVGGDDGIAGVAILDEVEGVAVVYDGGLGWEGCEGVRIMSGERWGWRWRETYVW
jgi:hypothetical protein